MPQKHAFSSPSLQKVNAEADVIISNHLQALDRISNDIKALEEKLRSAAVPFTFIYVLHQGERRYEDTYEGKFQEYIETCLAWGKFGDSIEPRLCYNIYTTSQEILNHSTDNGWVERLGSQEESKLFSSKALIESKANIRLYIERDLPGFYQGLIESIACKNCDDRVFRCSPNYNKGMTSPKIVPEFYFPF